MNEINEMGPTKKDRALVEMMSTTSPARVASCFAIFSTQTARRPNP